MQKTSVITQVLFNRTYSTNYGDLHAYKIILENGDSGEISVKKMDSLQIGESLTYTVEPSQYGPKIKKVSPAQTAQPAQPQQATGYAGNSVQRQAASFALSYAKDEIVAMVQAGKTGDSTSEVLAERTLAVANKFYEWLISRPAEEEK